MRRSVSAIQLPIVALVQNSEIERLRQKFAETKSAADHEAFWQAVANSRQPVIEEQPDYPEVPKFLRRDSIDWDSLPV